METNRVRPQREGTPRPAACGRGATPVGHAAKLALISLGLLGIVSIGAWLTVGFGSSRNADGPRLTHAVARGDLVVTVHAQGLLESAENTEIKSKVRGRRTVTWVIDSGSVVEPGDELVRLDTLSIENAIAERTKFAHWSRSAAERSQARVARAELAIGEYQEGRYRADLMNLEKDLAIAESRVRTARNFLDHAQRMAERGYVSELEVEGRSIDLRQAELGVEVLTTDINVLKEYTKAMELETLQGNFKAAKAKLAADRERAELDASRRDQALEELEHCVVVAETAGMVIHPNAARWRNAPPIAEGATVHKDQVLLLMPDLSRMQVKVGIHEAFIDRIRSGLPAKITLPDRVVDGTVSSVASVAAPASFWTGDVVKYETLIDLPPSDGCKPGMSADVELIIQRHEDVLRIPVAAVVETADGDFCWVKTDQGTWRRPLRLGDTNDVFTVVQSGLAAGEEVVLNPAALEAETPRSRKREAKSKEGNSAKDGKSDPAKSGEGKPGGASENAAAVGTRDKSSEKRNPRISGAKIVQAADKNGDGVLTLDEFAEKDRARFPTIDANDDGEVDAGEIDAALKAAGKAKSE